MTLDIKNFYFNTPLARYKYLRLKLSNFPDDVLEEYNLKKRKKGYFFVRRSTKRYLRIAASRVVSAEAVGREIEKEWL